MFANHLLFAEDMLCLNAACVFLEDYWASAVSSALS